MKKNLLLLLTVFIAFSFTACNAKNTNNTGGDTANTENVRADAYPKTITDTRDISIELQSEPTKIISFNPNITEIIFALGAGDKLVGRTDYCTYPTDTSNVASIGDTLNPNYEMIISLEADIAICSNMLMDEVIQKVEDSGVKIIKLGGEDKIDNTYDNIRLIADIVNKQEEAEVIIQNMQNDFQDVKDKVSNLEKPTVYYVVGLGEFGDYTAGGNTFIGEMINISGGINIAESVTDWKYSLEKIVENDPYIIFCPNKYGNLDMFVNTSGYNELTAVKEGRIYDIDEDLLTIAGPRLGEGAKVLAKLLHPEIEFE